MGVHQSLVADAGHGASRVAAHGLGTLQVVLLHMLLDVGQEPLGVHLGQRQVDDALDAKHQSYHQCKGYQRHEPSRALHELCLQLFVQSVALGHGLQGVDVFLAYHLLHSGKARRVGKQRIAGGNSQGSWHADAIGLGQNNTATHDRGQGERQE